MEINTDDFDFLRMLKNRGEVYENDLDRLEQLSHHQNYEIRNDTAIVLCLISNQKSEQILCTLLKDKGLFSADQCVRFIKHQQQYRNHSLVIQKFE